jgi:crotonobetainyl-CoA:carnitine CoA-transferase CaiB-like acyl-CoA transferase
MRPPLSGLRVLDLSRSLAGPFATMRLADMGADVLKVEPPAGDETRGWGPPFVGGVSTYFLSINRNKRLRRLDIKERPDELRRLVRWAHVLVENFKPGTLPFDPRRVNPKLVHCTITGYRKFRPAYDTVLQAECGLMDLTGPADGPPCKVGITLVDEVAGLTAVEAILAALRRGKGCRLVVPLLDSIVSFFTYRAQEFLSTGRRPRRMGNLHPNLTPYEPLPVRDGWVMVGVANEGQWARFCGAIGIAPSRWPTNARRVRNRLRVRKAIEAALRRWTAAKLVRALDAARVPCGRVQSIADVLRDRSLLVRAGPHAMVGHPVREVRRARNFYSSSARSPIAEP